MALHKVLLHIQTTSSNSIRSYTIAELKASTNTLAAVYLLHCELRNPNLDCHCWEGEARSNPGCMALFLDCFAEPVQSDSEVLAMTIVSFVIHNLHAEMGDTSVRKMMTAGA